MVSNQGKYLCIAIVGGLAVGIITWRIVVDSVPLTFYLLQNNELVRAGAYWQLLTSILVVFPDPLGAFDVLFNALAVLVLDRFLSASYTLSEHFSVFLICGVAGNLLSLFVTPASTISFGASGGIFGLLAGAISTGIFVEHRVDPALLTWFALVFVFSSFALPSVDWAAHLGGTLAGLASGAVIGGKASSSD